MQMRIQDREGDCLGLMIRVCVCKANKPGDDCKWAEKAGLILLTCFSFFFGCNQSLSCGSARDHKELLGM